MDEKDLLHNPRPYAEHKSGGSAKSKGGSTIPAGKRHGHPFPWRGITNVSVLTGVDTGLLFLFIYHPVLTFYREENRNNAIQGNVRVNSTGVYCFSFSFVFSFLAGQALPCSKF